MSKVLLRVFNKNGELTDILGAPFLEGKPQSLGSAVSINAGQENTHGLNGHYIVFRIYTAQLDPTIPLPPLQDISEIVIDVIEMESKN